MGLDLYQRCFLLDIFLSSYSILVCWALEPVLLFIDKLANIKSDLFYPRKEPKYAVYWINNMWKHMKMPLYGRF